MTALRSHIHNVFVQGSIAMFKQQPTINRSNHVQRSPIEFNWCITALYHEEMLDYMDHHIRINAYWLQEMPRDSETIEATLFPSSQLGQRDQLFLREAMNYALFGAGYSPDVRMSSNPTWSWREGH